MSDPHVETFSKVFRSETLACSDKIYCHVPARWGLQQTTWAQGSDKTQGQGSFGAFTTNLVIATYKHFKKKNGPYTRPVLLRQGEPGMSQYYDTKCS